MLRLVNSKDFAVRLRGLLVACSNVYIKIHFTVCINFYCLVESQGFFSVFEVGMPACIVDRIYMYVNYPVYNILKDTDLIPTHHSNMNSIALLIQLILTKRWSSIYSYLRVWAIWLALTGPRSCACEGCIGGTRVCVSTISYSYRGGLIIITGVCTHFLGSYPEFLRNCSSYYFFHTTIPITKTDSYSYYYSKFCSVTFWIYRCYSSSLTALLCRRMLSKSEGDNYHVHHYCSSASRLYRAATGMTHYEDKCTVFWWSHSSLGVVPACDRGKKGAGHVHVH